MSIAGCMKIFLLTDKHLTGNQMFSFKFVDLQILFENVRCQNMMTLLCYSFLFNAYFSQSCFTLQLVVSIHTWKYRLAYFFKRIAILRFSCVEGLHFLLFCLPSISLFFARFSLKKLWDVFMIPWNMYCVVSDSWLLHKIANSRITLAKQYLDQTSWP